MIPRLCFVTDAAAALSVVEQVMAAAAGGAGWIQLRDKTLDDQAFYELAALLLDRLRPFETKLIVNDRVAVAQALPVAGLHIGQSDGDPTAIRQCIGNDKILGLSVGTVTELAAAPITAADYFGIGPIRATPSKPDHSAPIGFAGLSDMVSEARLPCLAIGGLTPEDVPMIKQAGCVGLAVVSAISRAADPEAATRAFLTHWMRS